MDARPTLELSGEPCALRAIPEEGQVHCCLPEMTVLQGQQAGVDRREAT